MPTFEFFLDSRGLLTKEFEIDVTATLPKVTVQVFDGDTAVNLTGAAVTFTLRDAQGAAVVLDAAAVLLDATNGIVEYQLKDADVDDVGFFFAQFKITISGESYLIPNDSTQRLRLRIGKEDVPAFSSAPASLPVHAKTHDLGGSDQIALEALLAAGPPGTIFVDGNRTDPYTESGSLARPFKDLAPAFAAATELETVYRIRRKTTGLYSGTSPLILPTGSVTLFGEDGIPGTDLGMVWQPVAGTFLHLERFSVSTAFATALKVSNKDSTASSINVTLRDMDLVLGGTLSLEFLNEQAAKIIRLRGRGSSLFPFFIKMKFQPKNAGDLLCLEDLNLDGGLETTADAVAASIELSKCRIKHKGITGGDPAQKIFAANCSTDNGDSTVAPLDALDFQGLHTFQIAG